MALNKSKGNMYTWVTHTWNPLAGKCEHNCSYCSTNRFHYPVLKDKYSGSIRICEKTLKDNLGEFNCIFVAAQNDLFASNVPDDMINRILDRCKEFTNDYLFQTKNPGRILFFNLPESKICTTIESNFHYWQMGNSPSPYQRAKYMEILAERGFETYVTIEPIMDFNLPNMVDLIKMCAPYQVNIGADSGKNNLPEPTKENILALIEELEKFTKVVKKSNLTRLLK